MCFGYCTAFVPVGNPLGCCCISWGSEVVDTSMHDMGLHGFKIHAILEVVQLCSYANATQDPGIVGSKKKCGVGL